MHAHMPIRAPLHVPSGILYRLPIRGAANCACIACHVSALRPANMFQYICALCVVSQPSIFEAPFFTHTVAHFEIGVCHADSSRKCSRWYQQS
jgi:hypothetical protein